MDAIHPQRLSRISTLLIASLGVAFAWVLLSLVLGLSASQARADDDGLLGTVTSAVAHTASSATEIVSDTTSAASDLVADTAAAVSEPVAPPAPVAPVIEHVQPVAAPVVETVAPVIAPITEVVTPVVESVTPVVETVESTVSLVTTGVTEIADAGVVSPVVDAGVEVVTSLPIAGDAVASTGVDDALSSVGHTVDGVLQGTTDAVIRPVTEIVDTVTGPVEGVVDGTVPAVLTPVPPVTGGLTPPSPALVAEPASSLSRSPVHAASSASGPLDYFARAAVLSGTALWMAVAPSASTVVTSADAAALGGGASNDPISLLRATLQSESSFVGPGGAGPGAWALIALAFVFAYRAWMRRTGLEDDATPVAPTYSTDVSPD
ncbi:hypothetical protein ABC304_00720 [Microbacterium sp. 1P10UB]|uniref:hypothetical protein n=1 Tax=unclassified Microbacterium TaxID=2609290 RepID=UPI0039A2AB2A